MELSQIEDRAGTGGLGRASGTDRTGRTIPPNRDPGVPGAIGAGRVSMSAWSSRFA